jgi:hypothetical protein
MLVALIDLKDSMAAERAEMLSMMAEREAAMKEQVAAVRAQAAQDRAASPPAPAQQPMAGYYDRPHAWQGQDRYGPPQMPTVQAVPAPAGPTLDDVRALVRAELRDALASVEPSAKGLGEDDVAAIARREAEAVAGPRVPQVSPDDMLSMARSLEAKLSAVESRIGDIERKATQGNGERVELAKISRLNKDVERLDWKVEQLMDETGFGESMDVSKIPSNILEIVYQATLDDVVREMGKTRSQQEVGTIIEAQLEEVRKNTSGSELFRYNGRRILAENLARSIDHGLISAKQIQTTYAELLAQLLESVPAYKPKNFRAMIKIKSQEYAVDRVTHLLARTEGTDRVLDNMGQMIAAFSAQSNARFTQFSGRLDEIAGPMMERKVDSSQFEEVKLALNEVRLAVAELSKESSRLLAKIELGAAHTQAGGEAPTPAAEVAPREPPAAELSEGEKLIVSMLASGEMSVSALRKQGESFLSADDIKNALDSLRAKGLVESRKGRKGTKLALASPTSPGDGAVVSQPELAGADAEPLPTVVYAPEADMGEGVEQPGTDSEGRTAQDGPNDASGGETTVGAMATPESGEVTVVEGGGVAESSGGPAQPPASSEPAKPVELTELQKRVLAAVGDGATMPSLRKSLEDLKYTEVLVAVRVLMDYGLVEAESHGRGTTYKTVKGAKLEEVKNDA